MALQSIGLDLIGISSRVLTRSWDLQRSYSFQVFMPSDIAGYLGPEVSQFCVSAKLGNYDVADLSSMQYGAYQRFYAGLQKVGQTSLTFLNPTSNVVLNYFTEWSYLILDRQGYYSPKSHYAKDIFLVTYDQNHVETNRFRLRGCWPTQRPKPDMSYSKEDVTYYTISLAVDQVEPGSLLAELGNTVRRVYSIAKQFG